MDDDGLLVNFSIGDGVLPRKTVYKGGPWKERRRANRLASLRTQNAGKENHSSTPKSNEDAAPDARPVKRQRTEDEGLKASTSKPPAKRANAANGTHGPPSQKQVISSLFTYNPSSSTSKEFRPARDESPLEPSNAPLKSELDTFTSLGLSTTLAAHLLKKMDLTAPTAIQKAAIPRLLKDHADAFIQAETGSGKTLSYLLPLVQKIMGLSSARKTQTDPTDPDAIHRDSGLFAIILAPTRELSKQIAVVLESLLRCAHWIVSGTVTGGEKKKAEKARLRKGLNILVATPGRLVDHLDHTETLDVSTVRWLVLDEGDRLMELGFEQDIQKIVARLNLRMKAQKPLKMPGLPSRRMTILCSATLKMGVERLGQISLKDAVHVQGTSDDAGENHTDVAATNQKFSAPSQLQQSYTIVPAKLRLVTLIAALKRAFAHRGSVMKAIVFLSCADSVDFHFDVLARPDDDDADNDDDENDSDASDPSTHHAIHPRRKPSAKAPTQPTQPTSLTPTSALSPLLSTPTHTVHIHRLHGSLPQPLRTSTLAAFARSPDPALLLATDVASRGLDVPNVDLVLEYDPAFSHDDHLHRIGRTARAGRPGRSLVFLLPGAEEGYVALIKGGGADGVGRAPVRHDAAELLRRAFGAPKGADSGDKKRQRMAGGKDWEQRATALQLGVERWALAGPERLERARRAYQSHVRAYATHVLPERRFFDVKLLHLGHLAKAFGLRDRPGGIGVPGMRGAQMTVARRGGGVSGEKGGPWGKGGRGDEDGRGRSVAATTDGQEAARKMRAKMREQTGGASEFNLA